MNRSTVRNSVVAVAALLALFPTTAMAAAPASAPAKAAVATARHHKLLPHGTVVTGNGRRLHVRSGAGVTYRATGTLRSGRQVLLVCKKDGSAVQGNRVWYRLAGHHARYVSAHYVRVAAGSAVPWC
ncbi:SH3 domain-containing protein [Streptomyces sp. NBC_00083]|uniref:SH3 domain-containing protein n=1 Tax=Streptomyces sp. NBC_00083 TaxID=2975647 RepID=UPI0022546217|nr:SH3 domain-containing protein [Streptomyces sp. NBC_00083]MCX5388211.1 SH3 domain-containing protein [Streptomyces sp. NBC_00083]